MVIYVCEMDLSKSGIKDQAITGYRTPHTHHIKIEHLVVENRRKSVSSVLISPIRDIFFISKELFEIFLIPVMWKVFHFKPADKDRPTEGVFFNNTIDYLFLG